MSTRLAHFVVFLMTSTLLLCVSGVAADRAQDLDPDKTRKPPTKPWCIVPIALGDASGNEQTRPADESSSEATCLVRWQGAESDNYPNWLEGNSSYTVYQDPAEQGCTYPFEVTSIHFYLFAHRDTSIIFHTFGYDCVDPAPSFGELLWVNTWDTVYLPHAGLFDVEIATYLYDVITEPYWAVITIAPHLEPSGVVDIVLDDGQEVPPRGGAVWYMGSQSGMNIMDLLDLGFTRNLILFTEGQSVNQNACCGMYDPDDRTGNVDQDPGNVKDLTDILMLASYAFLGGDPPPCMADMNVSGDPGCVNDLSDVLDLASYAFLGGGLPAYCLPECE